MIEYENVDLMEKKGKMNSLYILPRTESVIWSEESCGMGTGVRVLSLGIRDLGVGFRVWVVGFDLGFGAWDVG